jgi:hypothetical protein
MPTDKIQQKTAQRPRRTDHEETESESNELKTVNQIGGRSTPSTCHRKCHLKQSCKSAGLKSSSSKPEMKQTSTFLHIVFGTNKEGLETAKSFIHSHSTSSSNDDSGKRCASMETIPTDEGIAIRQSDVHLPNPPISLK